MFCSQQTVCCDKSFRGQPLGIASNNEKPKSYPESEFGLSVKEHFFLFFFLYLTIMYYKDRISSLLLKIDYRLNLIIWFHESSGIFI